jgi:hypothetical protein
MRNKQIEFPPEQTHVSWLTPAMLGFSVFCAVLCIIILLVHESGPFIGPWG